jgi:uncharacterized membrane protein YdjX (TVP38/TMEM64 family)
MIRLLVLVLVLGLAAALPFGLAGARMEALLGGEQALIWLSAYGPWAWLAGMLLLAGDLVLPVSATAVMAGLGMLYGPALGGLLGGLGSFAAGALGYLACRAFGRNAARAILGRDGFVRAERWFSAAGGWIVALSRALPILPELVVCMAGCCACPPSASSLPFSAAVCPSASCSRLWVLPVVNAR